MSIEAHRGAIQTKTGPRGGKWWRRGNGAWQSGEPPQLKQLEPTQVAVSKAEGFLREKWAERAAELGRSVPLDLTGACKFASLFAQTVFGGVLRGNWHHQWVEHPSAGRIDLTKSEGVEGHSQRCARAGCAQREITQHDARFWGNSDHKSDMTSIRDRVHRWATEFAEKNAQGRRR